MSPARQKQHQEPLNSPYGPLPLERKFRVRVVSRNWIIDRVGILERSTRLSCQFGAITFDTGNERENIRRIDGYRSRLIKVEWNTFPSPDELNDRKSSSMSQAKLIKYVGVVKR